MSQIWVGIIMHSYQSIYVNNLKPGTYRYDRPFAIGSNLVFAICEFCLRMDSLSSFWWSLPP